MFDFLKKRLKDSVEKLTKKTENPLPPAEVPRAEKPAEAPKTKMEKAAPRIEKLHKLERSRLLTPSN